VGEQVLQLATGLRECGMDVEVLGRGPGAVGGPKLLFPLFAVPALRRAVRRLEPDVVQVHESDGGLAIASLRWWPVRQAPKPLRVALLQVSYREERRAVRPLRSGTRIVGRPGAVERRFRWLKAPVQIALGWLTAHSAECVLAPSVATAGELERDYGVAGVRVVPNATGGIEHEREEAGTEASGYLLFVGRLRIRKGLEILLDALALLEPGMAARLLVAGEGEHRSAVERRVGELGLGDRVVFLGRASGARVRALLAGAAALVVPSIYEGMPLVVLEAMEAGIPVVASRVSGIPEVVVDGTTGWLVAPENPAALADALQEALAQPEERRRRGAAGRERVARLYRPRAVAQRWRDAVTGVGGNAS
jgi:glycosyltransferase involved in cell wall biosynthesis